MDKLMANYVRPIKITKRDYQRMLSKLRFLLTYPEKSMEYEHIDPDQASRGPAWVRNAEQGPITQRVV